MTGLTANLRRAVDVHAPIRRPFGRSGVLHRQKKAHLPTAPLHHPGTRAVPCAITAEASPCHLAHMRILRMTRPPGHQSALRMRDSWPPPKPHLLAVLPCQQPASSPSCFITCFASMKKHLAKGCHYARNAPTIHRTPRRGAAEPARDRNCCMW
jgi:hypothetical protein